MGVAFAEKPRSVRRRRVRAPESDAAATLRRSGPRSRHGARHGSRADEATAAAYGALVAEQATRRGGWRRF